MSNKVTSISINEEVLKAFDVAVGSRKRSDVIEGLMKQHLLFLKAVGKFMEGGSVEHEHQ